MIICEKVKKKDILKVNVEYFLLEGKCSGIVLGCGESYFTRPANNLLFMQKDFTLINQIDFVCHFISVVL